MQSQVSLDVVYIQGIPTEKDDSHDIMSVERYSVNSLKMQVHRFSTVVLYNKWAELEENNLPTQALANGNEVNVFVAKKLR